jgi:glycosyltransferase involved in cell wall biosynthesis
MQAITPSYPRTATVCHLLNTLSVGGVELLAARLAGQLAGRYRFVFICLDELGSVAGRLRGEGFPVTLLGRRPGLDPGCALRLARQLRRYRVDLIHAHTYGPFLYGSLARLLYRRPALLFAEHARPFPDRPRLKRVIANRLLLERRDRVVGVSQWVRQTLIHNERIPPGRVEVIANGIDPTTFPVAPLGRGPLRRALGVGEHDLVLMQVARLDRIKDHATALRVLRRVVHRRPDARLVLVGDGSERQALQDWCGRNGLTPHLRLLGERGDVARLLPAADVLLHTSVSEAAPLAVMEGMAAGLAVVATAVGGTGEIVADGRTGVLCPPGDDAALAEGVLALAGDPARRQEMGRLGRERIRVRFSEAVMCAAYDALYREMLHGREDDWQGRRTGRPPLTTTSRQ